MIMHLKARLFALLLIVVCSGLVYYNWHQLLQEHQYSMKLAAFAPLCVVGGFFLLIFPSMAGKPTTTRDKIIVLLVFLIGLAAGLINWFLMDPGFFGR
jgi:CDP-diglyceride synthetase